MLVFGQYLAGQSFSVSPTTVTTTTSEYFNIKYTLKDGSLEDFQAPSFANFSIVGGPNRSQTMSISNGAMNRSVTIEYILLAKKSGTFTLPAATVTVNGKSLRSKKVTVKVNKGKSNSSKGNNNNQTATKTAQDLEEMVFLRIITDTTSFYQGQQVTVKYRLYTTVNITDYTVAENPALTGFWVQDLTPSRLKAGQREVIDEVEYTTYDLKTYALFPQRPGTLIVDPMGLEVEAKLPTQRRTMFGFGYTMKHLTLKSDTAKLTIYPLPKEEKPENFGGAVGKYRLTATLDKRNTKVNDAITLKVSISGQGNIKLIDAPKLNLPEAFETFDPQIAEDIYPKGNVVNGRKTFTYTLMPSEKGKFMLEGINYGYFDPETKTYSILSSPKQQIYVAAADAVNDPNLPETRNALSGINNAQHLHQKDNYFFNSLYFWILFILPFVGFPIALISYQKQQVLASDVVGMKRKKANLVAKQRLSVAQSYLKSNDKRAFYNEVIHAIWGYLGDKLNMKLGELDKPKIKQVLEKHQIDSVTIEKVVSTIDYCEMALFAPVKDADNLKETYQNSIQLISDIDEQLT